MECSATVTTSPFVADVPLSGREAELGALGDLLGRAAVGLAGCVLIRGEAGIGKTALLDAVATAAVGAAPNDGAGTAPWTVTRATGVQTESGLAYAGLLACLRRLQPLIAELVPAQQRALTAALGWTDPVAGIDRFLVGAATLSLLAAAAAHSPVLLVLDDVQWLDGESLDALLFALRRLDQDRVTAVLAQRAGVEAPVSLDGLPILELTGLTPAAARTMLGPGFTDAVASELTARTGGNPLALVECRQRLSPSQRAGAAPLPDVLPTPERLAEWYRPLIRGLAAPARRLAVLAAAAGSPTATPILAAATGAGIDPDVALATTDDVLRLRDGLLEFRHPLLRAAVWADADGAERRAANLALAATDPDPASAIWHEVNAALGPDEDLAARLVAVATADRARRGYAASSAGFERASTLSRSRADRVRRLAQAAEDAFAAGDSERGRQLARTVLDAEPAPDSAARVLMAMGLDDQYNGSLRSSADLLARATDLATGLELLRGLTELGLASYLLDDREAMASAAARAAASADPEDPEQAMLAAYLAGASAVFEGRIAEGMGPMLRAVELMETDPGLRDNPRYFVLSLLAARWLYDPRVAEPYAERRMAGVRSAGALPQLSLGLSFIATGSAMLGDHVAAYAYAGEAVELAEALGHRGDPGVGLQVLAEECAGRGRHNEAAEVCRRLMAAAEFSRITTSPAVAHTMAYVARCRGDHATVIAVLEEQLRENGGVGPALEPLGVAPMLIEAYLAVGRLGDAVELSHRFDAAQDPHLRSQVQPLVLRCRALVADDLDRATEAFEAALALPRPAFLDPLEVAMTRLLYGMRLRRSGQRVAARAQLVGARTDFAAMHQTHWETVAIDELAGTGQRADRSDGPRTALTSQETRVALLVARGATNKEVAAALFLSPKTVEHHLAAVLRKRGLRSRVELAADFAHIADQPA